MVAAGLWTWPETQRDPLGGTPDIVGFKTAGMYTGVNQDGYFL